MNPRRIAQHSFEIVANCSGLNRRPMLINWKRRQKHLYDKSVAGNGGV